MCSDDSQAIYKTRFTFCDPARKQKILNLLGRVFKQLRKRIITLKLSNAVFRVCCYYNFGIGEGGYLLQNLLQVIRLKLACHVIVNGVAYVSPTSHTPFSRRHEGGKS